MYLRDLDEVALDTKMSTESTRFICEFCRRGIGSFSSIYFAKDMPFCSTACRRRYFD